MTDGDIDNGALRVALWSVFTAKRGLAKGLRKDGCEGRICVVDVGFCCGDDIALSCADSIPRRGSQLERWTWWRQLGRRPHLRWKRLWRLYCNYPATGISPTRTCTAAGQVVSARIWRETRLPDPGARITAHRWREQRSSLGSQRAEFRYVGSYA